MIETFLVLYLVGSMIADDDSICIADRDHGSTCKLLCLTHGTIGDGVGKEYKEDKSVHTDMYDGVHDYHLYPDSVPCEFGYPTRLPPAFKKRSPADEK